jgi:D-glycero-alpha-D-manno-heptose-7-phosphate kinase
VLQEYGVTEGVEIQHYGDLPARSGMGSSSSFTVGLLNALRAHRGQMSSAEDLAKEAIRIEQEVIKEAVGSQDQVWAAYGGTNIIRFHPSGRFDVVPVIMTRERRADLRSHLLLFFTRFSRTAETIAARKIENLRSRYSQLHCMQSMAEQAISILQNTSQPLTEIGTLLNDSWRLKKELADCVTTDAIDEIYGAALLAGALGGKLLGAGGGGFMLLFGEPHTHGRIRESLKDLIEVSFDIGSPGSSIVIYEPNGLGARTEHA